MAEIKKLPGLLFDKSTRWWFSNIRDTRSPCGRIKHLWAKNKHEAAEKAAVEFWSDQLFELATFTDLTKKLLSGVRDGV